MGAGIRKIIPPGERYRWSMLRMFPAFTPVLALFGMGSLNASGQTDGVVEFEKDILPILEDNCYQCHGDGEDKGKVTLDTFGGTADLMKQTDLWVHVLKNIRSGMMPPAKKDRIAADDFTKLEKWIKNSALQLDPAHPDPGRVTLRRLNRVEYRNTIRDLMGIDFRTDEEFPADDTGYGFDTIGDVLSTSSLLLEKYMQAAETIVARAVPLVSRVAPQREIQAHYFNGQGGRDGSYSDQYISLYEPADITAAVEIPKSGTYRVMLNSPVRRSYAFDPGRAEAEWFVDGKLELRRELKWVDGMKLDRSTEVKWEAGRHELRLSMKPLVGFDEVSHMSPEGPTSAGLNFQGVTLVGPLEEDSAIPPEDYARFFPRSEVPTEDAGRLQYAEEILRRFTTLAFRRPVDDRTVLRLVALATESADMPGGNFEKGIARAMTAVLASPRFLFRVEKTLPETDPAQHPLLDEWALASRLSYFLWSTMPDETLINLAERGELRNNLRPQVERMIQDEKSGEFVKNFAGQWLQTRDVENASIDARIVLARDNGRKSTDAKAEFKGSLRGAMRREAEMLFGHLLRSNGSVLKLIENDSTFLNQELAEHYGVPGVDGGEMRLVKLPADSPRGGVLTMGTVLTVTSNATRTSPVKRGLFILDNILGAPPPPPPPNIPSLEASEKNHDGSERSLREALALHREKPLCSSCHDRMDPLGLALENFNAMGHWRERELGADLGSPAGQLITGEKFADVRELKHILVTQRRHDFYRCLTEKLLTYSLGRGPEACDILTVDAFVEHLGQTHGQFSSLITGIIESTPFQRRHHNSP
jgi:hypothetical protein